jgi:hypothetical protein
MFSQHPLKQILKDTIADWDHDGTPQNVRKNFWKIINCGTLALGAEVLASDTQWRIVYHTCKSLLAPRLKNRLSVVFLLLNQKRRARPMPLSWAQLSYRTFGTDPSIDRHGKQMVCIGRLSPANS